MMPADVAGAVYGELAYHRQTLLRSGAIVHVAGDTFAPGPGMTYLVRIGDRRYELKAGFAELALNTGASVIPSCARFLEDGRLLHLLLPPLDAGRGTREQQIQHLLDQYAAYVTDEHRAHPAMTWKRMWNHLLHATVEES
jgi:hypothetical protein